MSLTQPSSPAAAPAAPAAQQTAQAATPRGSEEGNTSAGNKQQGLSDKLESPYDFLIRHVNGNPGKTFKHRITWLDAAAYCGRTEIVNFLLSREEDYMDAKNKALMLAACEGHTEIVQSLIAAGADVNAIDKGHGSITVLIVAVQGGHRDVVELLLKYGANASGKDNHRNTALHWAAGCGHTGILKPLIAAEAEVAAVNEDGSTALMLAAEMGWENIVKELYNQANTKNTVVPTISTPRAVNPGSPREDADDTESEVVRSLRDPFKPLFYKSRLNTSGKFGRTALMAASMNGQVEVVKFLLENGADVAAKDNAKDTALTLAVKGHTELIRAMIESGADVEPIDTYELSVFHLVEMQRHTAVIKRLLETGVDGEDVKGTYMKIIEESPSTPSSDIPITNCQEIIDMLERFPKRTGNVIPQQTQLSREISDGSPDCVRADINPPMESLRRNTLMVTNSIEVIPAIFFGLGPPTLGTDCLYSAIFRWKLINNQGTTPQKPLQETIDKICESRAKQRALRELAHRYWMSVEEYTPDQTHY